MRANTDDDVCSASFLVEGGFNSHAPPPSQLAPSRSSSFAASPVRSPRLLSTRRQLASLAHRQAANSVIDPNGQSQMTAESASLPGAHRRRRVSLDQVGSVDHQERNHTAAIDAIDQLACAVRVRVYGTSANGRVECMSTCPGGLGQRFRKIRHELLGQVTTSWLSRAAPHLVPNAVLSRDASPLSLCGIFEKVGCTPMDGVGKSSADLAEDSLG
jgi:hypothetical protein